MTDDVRLFKILCEFGVNINEVYGVSEGPKAITFSAAAAQIPKVCQGEVCYCGRHIRAVFVQITGRFKALASASATGMSRRCLSRIRSRSCATAIVMLGDRQRFLVTFLLLTVAACQSTWLANRKLPPAQHL